MNPLVANALAKGWIHPPAAAPFSDPKHLSYIRAQRAGLVADNLTTAGTPRQRYHINLAGLTKAQKQARRRAQCLANSHAQRAAWLASGLTTAGTPRQRHQVKLAGLTQAQKQARHLAQCRANSRAQRASHLAAGLTTRGTPRKVRQPFFPFRSVNPQPSASP